MIDRITRQRPSVRLISGNARVHEAPILRARYRAAAGRKPLGGPSVNSPKGIEGAPENVNLDYFVDFFQRAFKSSMAILTGQGDGSAELPTSWWNATLLTVAAGFVTGLFVFIADLNFRSFLTVLTVPLLVTLMAVIGVGAGSFLSHWYLRTSRGATATCSTTP